MRVTYKCTNCGEIIIISTDKPTMTTSCKCGQKAIKVMAGLSLDKEDDTISTAIEKMKYATNPSGKQKTVI